MSMKVGQRANPRHLRLDLVIVLAFLNIFFESGNDWCYHRQLLTFLKQNFDFPWHFFLWGSVLEDPPPSHNLLIFFLHSI
jgi:hypothetical protein